MRLLSGAVAAGLSFLVVIAASGIHPAAGSMSLALASTSGLSAQARTAEWVAAENARAGTTSWRIPPGTPKGISGFADHVSAEAGDRVRLFVSTKAPAFRVEAYRLGFYQGLGGRLVWTSPSVTGTRQPRATIEPETNMARAPWSPSLDVAIDASWIQGTYLLKLVSSVGGQSYIPLIVRDDSSRAALVVQAEVTTWQAYNRWGGYSLYHGPDGAFATRSRVVSFDRPYGGRGATGLLTELPFIAIVERLGLDVTYWTDLDLHQRPALLLNHASLVSLDHDEYWSTTMRDAVTSARAEGVNLAFLGANSIYRHVRFEPSPLGADREMVCYKLASEDPLRGVDDAEVTANWRLGPMPRPESDILGAMYSCARAHADLVVVDGDAWVFEGTGLTDGAHIPGFVDMEYDRIFPDAPTPSSIQILARSPTTCQGAPDVADMTYYTARSGAGVFNAASQGLVKQLRCGGPVSAETCDLRSVRIVENVLNAFSAGPAGVAHPSIPNAERLGTPLQQPIDP